MSQQPQPQTAQPQTAQPQTVQLHVLLEAYINLAIERGSVFKNIHEILQMHELIEKIKAKNSVSDDELRSCINMVNIMLSCGNFKVYEEVAPALEMIKALRGISDSQVFKTPVNPEPEDNVATKEEVA